MLAYELATRVVEDPVSKLRRFAALYLLLGVIIGLILPIQIDPVVAYIAVSIFSVGYLLTWHKVRQITDTWISIRGLHIEANKTTRDVYKEKKTYLLDIVPLLIIPTFLMLVWYASTNGFIPMYTAIHVSSLGFMVNVLDWRHDVVHARQYRKLRKKELADGVDIILDWPPR